MPHGYSFNKNFWEYGILKMQLSKSSSTNCKYFKPKEVCMIQHDPAAGQQKSKRSLGFFNYLIIILMSFTVMACQKNGLDNLVSESLEDLVNTANRKINKGLCDLNKYENLSFRTRWELNQARAATAKYQNINNALADQYVDIGVDVENMGHHYMKASLVDATFDIRQPEILVYNKDKNGRQRLVAVEYAVPLSNPRPEGFYGDDDVWDGNTGFGLWLLHAWVWYYNPDGVFAPFNPRVHLH
jgi:hypothetical protein